MNKVLSLLGLARAAKKIVYGTDAVCDKMAKNTINLVFIASDASKATIERIEKKGYFYKVPIDKSFTSDELNQSMGLYKAMAFGVADRGFAKSIMNELNKERESN